MTDVNFGLEQEGLITPLQLELSRGHFFELSNHSPLLIVTHLLISIEIHCSFPSFNGRAAWLHFHPSIDPFYRDVTLHLYSIWGSI